MVPFWIGFALVIVVSALGWALLAFTWWLRRHSK
jgi:hypothetical protein